MSGESADTEFDTTDPDLVKVMNAWPTLPEPIRRATIADIDRTANAIVLREHKTARKTGKPRRIPIGQKLGELLK